MSFCATFLFHGSLNDFLRKYQKNQRLPYLFTGNPAIKDAIEAQGVPHPEVAQILVNGVSPGFVDTAMAVVNGVNELETDAFREIYVQRRRIPLARAARPDGEQQT